MGRRFWLIVLIAAVVFFLASAIFGVWGFLSVWIALGLIALVAFLVMGGRPGATDSPGFSTILLVLSGPFGFCLIFNDLLSPEA